MAKKVRSFTDYHVGNHVYVLRLRLWKSPATGLPIPTDELHTHNTNAKLVALKVDLWVDKLTCKK